jgi:redox-sensitive bicupin YhaK (pirin superfamily)
VSNLEVEPDEVVAGGGSAADGFELLEPREVPLGGPRARPVRRTLPQRGRSLIGAWCFVDHYGPDPVLPGTGMDVPPHPHTGLQTVSWLFAGEITHRDSVGSVAPVRPGQLNLMTAGSGIAHSEVATDATTMLHGAQLWVALPDTDRHVPPFFEAFVPDPVVVDGATLHVFLGSLAGAESSARVFTELLGAQVDLPPGSTVTLGVREDFEHGVLLDTGEVAVNGHPVPLSYLAYVAPGSTALTFTAGPDGARLLLIGGVPLGEQIVMWWNFIGRSHDEIVRFRTEWQNDVVGGGNENGRFGLVRGYDGRGLPAPELPAVRLMPRG